MHQLFMGDATLSHVVLCVCVHKYMIYFESGRRCPLMKVPGTHYCFFIFERFPLSTVGTSNADRRVCEGYADSGTRGG